MWMGLFMRPCNMASAMHVYKYDNLKSYGPTGARFVCCLHSAENYAGKTNIRIALEPDTYNIEYIYLSYILYIYSIHMYACMYVLVAIVHCTAGWVRCGAICFRIHRPLKRACDGP